MDKALDSQNDQATRLKKIRDFLGYSQRDMAAELGVVHGAIGLWEAGQRSIPGPVLLLMDLYERELGFGKKQQSQKVIDELESSWLTRSLKLSGLSAQFATRFVWNHLKGLLGQTTSSDDIQARTHKALSLKMADTFGKLKGLPMKLGQMVSYMNFHAPDLKGEAFTELQQWSNPLGPATVAEVIVKAFRQTPNQLFKRWSPHPFAAASIGQVHRGEIEDGTAVAVKIQYPDIKKLIHNDLLTAGLIDQLGSTLFSGQESGLWIGELRERLTEECDYLNEINNLKTFYALYKDHPKIKIPQVFEKYSTATVITTELVLGQTFEAWTSQAGQIQKNNAGEIIWDFSFGSIFKHGLFNGDPHPGNYLFHENHITFLDFGCVKKLNADFIWLWLKYIKALRDDNRNETRKIVMEFKVASNPDRFDFDYQHNIMKEWYRPFIQKESFEFNPAFMINAWNKVAYENPNLRVMNVPKEWILVNHMHWGIYSILSHLGASSNWYERVEEFL